MIENRVKIQKKINPSQVLDDQNWFLEFTGFHHCIVWVGEGLEPIEKIGILSSSIKYSDTSCIMSSVVLFPITPNTPYPAMTLAGSVLYQLHGKRILPTPALPYKPGITTIRKQVEISSRANKSSTLMPIAMIFILMLISLKAEASEWMTCLFRLTYSTNVNHH